MLCSTVRQCVRGQGGGGGGGASSCEYSPTSRGDLHSNPKGFGSRLIREFDGAALTTISPAL